MRQRDLKRLKAMLVTLTLSQRRELMSELQVTEGRAASVGIIEDRGRQGGCPHCGNQKVVRNGNADGLQRYKCRECGRTFNALTGTPLARLRQKGKWLEQAEVLRDGATITQAAAHLNVARSTAFRWRHRFMVLPKTVQAQALRGIAETDETFFLRSNKGQRKLDRKPRKRGGSASKRGLSKEQVPSGCPRSLGRHGRLHPRGRRQGEHRRRLETDSRIRRHPLYGRQQRTGCSGQGDRCHSPPRQCIRRPTGHRRRLSHPKRQCVRQPTQELDSPISWRGDQISGFVPGLVSRN